MWLEHCRVGQPDLLVKSMFPSFFRSVDVSILHYESSKLAKFHRLSFPMVNKISLVPFSLIHTDYL